jgi:zinc protease
MFRSLIVFLLLTAGILMTDAKGQEFFPYQYDIFHLENGLTAYIIPMQGSGLIAYYSIVRTGSRDEYEPGKSGFAHFFEHMMFRGTEKYPGAVYDRMVTEMGADANAYTTDDLTAFHMVLPSEYLERVVDLESDRFQNLSYKEQEFKTEAGAVYGEYRKGRVNPYSVLLEELQNTAFDVHTYKHTTMGFESDIKNMPNMYEYSLSFFNRYYRPENVVLLIVGDLNTDHTKEIIRDYYSGWKPGYVAPRIKKEPPQQKERTKNVTYPGKTLPILWIAYKGNAFKADDRMVAAATLLGDMAFGQNSEIYKRLVIREQKVEFIDNWFPINRDPKLLSIYARIKNEDDIPYVQTEIDRTVKQYQKELADKKTVNDLKKRVRYSFLMNLDTPDNIAGSLARFAALTGGIDDVNIWYGTIASITPEDIRVAAEKYFKSKQRTVVILRGEN